MEETEKEPIIGSLDGFYIYEDGSVFGIAFDKIFEKKGIEIYREFSLTSKRNFKNISQEILKTYEEIFLNDNGKFKKENLLVCLYNILDTKYKIMLGSVSYENFLEMINKITDSEDGLLMKEISKFVEEHYSLKLDEITEQTKNSKKKVNEELQFSDSHGRSLLKIAYLYRIMIPIISEFFTYNKENFAKNDKDAESDEFEDNTFDDANASVFSYLFEKFADDADALRNKLYKLTYSRIARTVYSDKRFWTAAKNIGVTKDSETLEIYKKLLTNAIPKLSIDEDKNIISFFQTVINNQIDFLLQNKFKYHYQTIGNTQNYERYSDSDDAVSEFEKLEIQMLRKDEGLHRLRLINLQKTLDELPERLNVTVSNEEICELTKTLKRHLVQERILSMFAMKYFKDKQVIRFLSFHDYCRLLLICKKFLEKSKYILIPQILTANCEKHRERANISGKKIRPLIESSKKYKEVFLNKFRNFSDDIEKPLSAIIGTTYSSVFKDNDGNEIFDSSVKVGKIADELIDLAILI